MSIYTLSRSPQVAPNYAFWEGGFSQDEAFRVRTDAENAMTEATIDGRKIDPTIRRSKVNWLKSDQTFVWLYDKLGYVARQLNGQYFQFALDGFHEDLQYTVYEANDEGHYDWHMDGGEGGNYPPRKLSMVLQLSSPDEYEGGDLEFMIGSKGSIIAIKELGMIYVFPSWLLHRVTPVTKGCRRSLVAWLSGPRFV
jgi:PKHD-type hydroxylase